MATDPRANDVAAYATAVRTALGDLPADEKTALLEDLEEHLSEIAAESEGPLNQRLGAPEQYAAELRTAYGAAHPRAAKRRAGLQDLRAASAWVRRSSWYREFRAFLPSLRPAWWVLRAYLAVLVLASWFSRGTDLRPIPNPFSSRGLLQVIATVVAIVVSVRLGQTGLSRDRGVRILARGLNGAIALFAFFTLASMGTYPSSMVGDAVSQQLTGAPGVYANGPVTNIYAYSKNGTPLTDVLLYDQDGRPLTVDGSATGLSTSYPNGADGQPITNAYPMIQRKPDGTPVVASRVAIPPWPSPTASPTVSPTATP